MVRRFLITGTLVSKCLMVAMTLTLLGTTVGFAASSDGPVGDDDAPDTTAGAPVVQSAISTQAPITGGGAELKQFDQLMLNLMANYNVPGGALAISKDGKLVFARGYGFANLEKSEPFKPTSLFSLASVTKAVTGVAALRLVDEGKLNLDDTLYTVLGKPKLENVKDKRVMDITVRQLLHHSAGWKSDFVGYDQQIYNQFTNNNSVPFETLLLYVMANYPLDYAPGTECHYSNFQFAALKCVIEHSSGQDFESYVNQHVMFPMGIRGNRLEPERGRYLSDEAHRYGPNLRPLPGGHPNDKLTGSLGSWESSVVDLSKFLTAVDGTRTKPFLSKASFDAMLAPVPPPVPVRQNGTTFGLGWDSVKTAPNGVLFEKNGGVPGVHTYIEHLPNNVDWVLFFNGTGTQGRGINAAGLVPAQKVMGSALKSMHQAIADVTAWPNIDLFEQYQR